MGSFKYLHKDYPIEKSYFLIAKFCLMWLGIYPQTERSSFLRVLIFVFHVVVLSLGSLGQFWYGFYYIKTDLIRGIDALCPAIPCAISVVKMLLVLWHSKELSRVLNHMKAVLLTDLDEENKKIIQHFAVRSTRLAFLLLVSGISANVVYTLRPLITNMVRLSMGMSYIFDDTPLKAMVPSVLLTLPWYPFTYALNSYMAQICITSFSGVDGMFITFCLYAAALLKILQKDLQKILESCTHMTPDENRKSYERLGEIVRRHNEIIDLVKKFSSLYMWIILIHFLTSALEIGASIIEALLYPGLRAIIYFTYTSAVTCELFLYCYGGSVVMDNGFELGMSAYLSNWYNYDKRVQKLILMIIIRSQKPLKIDTPFFNPSLETFTSIIETAGSIITVVKTAL